MHTRIMNYEPTARATGYGHIFHFSGDFSFRIALKVLLLFLIAVRDSNVPKEWSYSTSVVIRLWSCSEYACHDEMRRIDTSQWKY